MMQRTRRAAGWGAFATALAVGAGPGLRAGEGHGHGRVLPPNAVPRPGVDTVGYPDVGREQKWTLAREVIAASASALVHRPLASTAVVAGRATERLAVRAHELAAWAGSARPTCLVGRPGDGALDPPFGGPALPARLTLLPGSEVSLRSLLGLIDAAAIRVDLMMYGWEDDPTGREVAAALARAAGRGVRVRLLVDRGGYLIHNPPAAVGEPTFLDSLRGLPTLTLLTPGDPFFRFDHRKLAVVDGRTAWSGGMILTEVARRQWENLAFVAEGPVADQYAALFEDRWRDVGGAPEGPVRTAGDLAVAANARVRLVRTDDHDRSLKEAIYHAVDHARHHLYLENPYFSDSLLAEKLVDARRRGVDVRVVVTLRGNVESLNRYVVLTANRLWRGGVRVYLAPGMTHVKALSADGAWCYLGSGNFDELSLRNNREVGLSVCSPEVTSALDAAVFLPDLGRAEELTAPLPCPPDWLRLELFKLWF